MSRPAARSLDDIETVIFHHVASSLKRGTYGQLTCIDAVPCFLLFVHGLNRVTRGVRSHSVRDSFETGARKNCVHEPAFAPHRVARAPAVELRYMTGGVCMTPGSWRFCAGPPADHGVRGMHHKRGMFLAVAPVARHRKAAGARCRTFAPAKRELRPGVGACQWPRTKRRDAGSESDVQGQDTLHDRILKGIAAAAPRAPHPSWRRAVSMQTKWTRGLVVVAMPLLLGACSVFRRQGGGRTVISGRAGGRRHRGPRCGSQRARS